MMGQKEQVNKTCSEILARWKLTQRYTIDTAVLLQSRGPKSFCVPKVRSRIRFICACHFTNVKHDISMYIGIGAQELKQICWKAGMTRLWGVISLIKGHKKYDTWLYYLLLILFHHAFSLTHAKNLLKNYSNMWSLILKTTFENEITQKQKLHLWIFDKSTCK